MQIRGQDNVDASQETTDPNNSANQENLSPQDLNQSTSTNDPAPPELKYFSDPSFLNQKNLDSQNLNQSTAANPRITPGYPGSNDLQDIHGNLSSITSTLRNFKGNDQDGNRSSAPSESIYSSAPQKSNESTATGYPGGYYQDMQGNQGNLNSNLSSTPGYPKGYDQDASIKYSNVSSFVNQVNLDPQNVNKSTDHSRDYNHSNAPSKLKKSSASSPEANIIPQQTPNQKKELFSVPPGQFLPDNKPSARRDRNRSPNSKVQKHSKKSTLNESSTVSAQKRIPPVNSPLENETNFDAPSNKTNFDALRNQTNFDASLRNQTSFDTSPRNQPNFDDAPRNQPNFDVNRNRTKFDASPRNQTNFNVPRNHTNFDAPRNQPNFGAPLINQTNFDASPRNQTNFDIPINQTNFGVPLRNQNNFGAPPGNQTNFDAPSRNQTNFGAPLRNQNNFGAPPGNQTDFKPFPENQTNFNFPPGSQTNFGFPPGAFPEDQNNFNNFDAFPENQNNFDSFSGNQFNFDAPTHNFLNVDTSTESQFENSFVHTDQTDQPMELPDLSQLMNDNTFSNNKSGKFVPNFQGDSPNFFMNEDMSTPEKFSSSSFGGPSQSTYSDQESDVSDDFESSPKKNQSRQHQQILSVITKHKYYHAGSRINIDHEDLVEYIPGMYRLLDLCKDDGSNGLVDKIIISKDSLEKLCNEMVPYSFASISEINYNRLNLVTFRLIGCYGNHELIAKLLLNKRIINKQVFDCLTSKATSAFESRNKPSLRPGIYLLVMNPEVGLVIYWPEPGSYEENAHSQRKKNMTNMHRYLTKLTDHQLCFMSDKDLDCFEWKSDIENQNSDEGDDDNRTFEFEVKKSQEEQEDFKLFKGFEVILPEILKKNLVKKEHKNIPLSPMVVESTNKQAFITREIIKSAVTMDRFYFTVQISSLYDELRKKLKDKALRISHGINMENLKILVINGLNMEDELLGPMNSAIEAAKKESHLKKEREVNALKNDGELIKAKAYKLLRYLYGMFESQFLSNSSDQSDSSDEGDEKSLNLEQFDKNYPGMSKKLFQSVQIHSNSWTRMKKRFFYAKILHHYLFYGNGKAENQRTFERFVYDAFIEAIESPENNCFTIYSTFSERIEKGSSSYFFSYFNLNKIKSLFTNTNVNKMYEQAINIAKNTQDQKLIHDLLNDNFFGKYDDIKKRLVSLFYVEYSKWRNDTFPGKIKEIIPKFSDRIKEITSKFEEEFNLEKGRILEKEHERIINQIESMYTTGRIFRINNIICDSSILSIRGKTCRITFEEETSLPDQLQVTIYETSLDQSDVFQSQMNELYIPKPTLSYGHRSLGTSFQINPEIYDLRKIFQFENKKFLVILWNKKQARTELYYESVSSLSSVIQSNSAKTFKNLNTPENCYFAINESKGLIGIYGKDNGELNVYAFDEERKNLFNRNSNISVCQWYNGVAPDIQHFFFIQDTEELCLIENGGKAKLFSLVTNQFRPSVGQIPENTIDVMSTPDGACIVAFVKEKISEKSTENAENTENDDFDLSSDEENEKEVLRAYVYFCSNFGQEASKIIELPPEFQNLECLQFSFMNKHQMHLISLDFEKRLFYSSIVKITLEKTQYRFQQRKKKNPLGRVKLALAKNNYSLIKGSNTHFKRDIKVNENIVLMGERYCILEVISDTELKIVGTFRPIESTWIDFQIEPKTKLNGFIETYRLMYEKYPIDGCVDGGQVRPLNLRVVLDISDEDEIEKYQENFEEYITEMFVELRRTTKKPATMLKKFKTSVSTFNCLDIDDPKFLKKNSREFQLGEWIIQLSCLIPIQIAVARNNQLLPLRDGLSSTEIDQFDFVSGCGNHVDNIAQNISFGWYEGIFKHFGNRKVKVVSSMGEQSCGKSYMLNHLVGTTFDGSAMRCTEGAWMSLAVTPEYIYVALDFEGLRSLERTPQEDLFLTLLNTVVSNLILFKNQFSINRDMSLMFQRFQDGALLLNDPKLFQAKLCIIIKDVPSQDKDDIVREFTLRFNSLVAQEAEDNFITKMYPSGLVILPWALFSDAAYKNLKDVKRMLDKQDARYENARTFLQNIKVIMAKLKICDWGSLDENLVQIRVANLRRFIPTAISLGIEQKDPTKELLTNYDTGLEIENPTVLISAIIEDYDQSTELLYDSDLLLYDEESNFLDLSKDLRLYFEEKIQPRVDSTNDSEWFANFEKFIKYITERRVYRVQEWFSQNVSKFPQDNSDIVIGRYSLEQEIGKFSHFWTLCGLTCQDCNLKCLKNRDHADGQHDCLTDHECHAHCQFLESHLNGLIPQCSYKAAHSGKHACDKADHLCGEPCKLSSKRNCQKKCSKDIGHEDGIHLCQANRHYCGEPCSLITNTQRGDYKCPNQCIIPCEDEHDAHHCENDSACPIQCPIPDCPRRCESNDHFHAFSELLVNHFCGQEHQCQKDCEEPGVCKVLVEPKKQEDAYQGLVSTFTFIRHTQVSERLKCKIKIPPNSFEHAGKHSHDENTSVHCCDVQCKFCEYYCTLPYGHTQPLHETSHGNMIQTVFTSNDDKEFEYGGHKLKSGDQGTFVMCNLHCKDAGRHRHIDYCKNGNNCKNTKNLQHIQGKINPDPDQPKDYISHRLFWERTGFKEPYSAQEQAEFTKCDHECNDKKHRDPDSSGVPPSKSYCQLEIFHDPVDSSAPPPGNYGYVSLDGHHFNCDNPVTREATFHIVLVLDRSSSMSYSDKKPIKGANLPDPVYQNLVQKHNNRTGAVYSAVYSFLETRISTVKNNTPSNVAAPPKDIVSLILFDSSSEIIVENQKLDNSNYFMQEMLKHGPRGGTNFDMAIQKAGVVIDRHFDPLKTNIIIFCSDGECGVPENQLKQICSRNKQKGSPLYLYTILFGTDACSTSLERMKDIAKSYHPAASSGSLKCQFSKIMTEVNLVNHLTGVAESLRRHKPALLKKNV